MQPLSTLAPCLVGCGTLANPRDMLRALETLENIEYRYLVHSEAMDEGSATLVKLMADSESATMIVNGCLFLNVSSFRYLDFARDTEGRWVFALHGDGSQLQLTALPEATESGTPSRMLMLAEDISPDLDVLISLDEEDEEE